MSKKSITLHKKFLEKLKALDDTRIKFETAFSSSLIHDEDIRQAYAGLYLDLFTEFENLLEELFLGILKGEVKSNNPTIKSKIIIKPISELETVIHGTKAKKYLDWLPYPDITIPRAKIYLVDGKPFTLLTEIQKNRIANYHTIRNAIAHKSKKAMNEFNTFISSMTLLPIEKTPQGYLRNIPNPATGKTQLGITSDELQAITFILCN
jgi:hypothetical protein